MLTAIDERGNLVNLLEYIPENIKNKYYCPSCKALLVLKKGKIKSPHFAHKSLKTCHSWSENESFQHLELKKELYQWFSKHDKVEVERYLPELNQTPDLLVNDKIAIEIQCSSLSLQRLKERTENYRGHGFSVIWLMGNGLWLRKEMTELQKNLMYFSNNRGFYFWELDLQNRKLRLKSLIHQDLRGKIFHLTDEFSFDRGNLLYILRFPFLPQPLRGLSVKIDKGLKLFIHQQLFHRVAKWMRIQDVYYRKGKNILTELSEKAYVAPIGLNLLTKFADKAVSPDFIQITQNVLPYYQNFYESWQRNSSEKLYPPQFYAIMRECEIKK